MTTVLGALPGTALMVATALVLVVVVAGLAKLAYVPLALYFELRAWARRHEQGLLAARPLVTVVVPGYNEEKVIDASVSSILAQPYRPLEVILVDDGSTDSTAQRMRALAAAHEEVTFVGQANAGKGAALNTGFAAGRGEIVMFVDADGVFTDETIPQALRAFRDERVSAVCGDDRPVNLDRLQTRFLAFISHVGTGLVRRSLDVLGCTPVISGNNGAFRRSALLALTDRRSAGGPGPMRTDTLGEDIELTWRLQREGHKVVFAPRAVVYAESPSTFRGLWRQRVRWCRGLLQSLSIHRRVVFNPRYGVFGLFLGYSLVALVLVPVIQAGFLATVLAVGVSGGGWSALPGAGLWNVLAWLSLGTGLGLAVLAALLDRSPGDLRHAWTAPLWPLYSTLIGLTMVQALYLSARRAPSRWNKLERSGVISVGGVSQAPRAADDSGDGYLTWPLPVSASPVLPPEAMGATEGRAGRSEGGSDVGAIRALGVVRGAARPALRV